MGELCERDVKEYIVSAKQIKIIFVQSSGLICLMEKVLPMLFGEVFQVIHDKSFTFPISPTFILIVLSSYQSLLFSICLT
jgi:hypothetical protein